MSELDKVTLNMIFPPRRRLRRIRQSRSAYNPKEFECAGTNMFYCFRDVMESHNNPYNKISNGICGGDQLRPSGPNCPACRTLQCKRSFLKDGKWQGWSGMIYCGKTSSHPCGHTCGSDYGYPCNECKALTYICTGQFWIQHYATMIKPCQIQLSKDWRIWNWVKCFFFLNQRTLHRFLFHSPGPWTTHSCNRARQSLLIVPPRIPTDKGIMGDSFEGAP